MVGFHGMVTMAARVNPLVSHDTLSFRRQVTGEAEILGRDDSVAGSPVALWEIGP